MDKKEFSYYTYEVGRYLPDYLDDKKTFVPYKAETKKLVWNIIDYDFNKRKIQVRNLFEYNWVFLKDLLDAKKKYSDDFIKFADFIRHCLQYRFWSKCEYETVICGWPADSSLKQKDLDELQEKLNYEKKHNNEAVFGEAYIDIGYPSPCYKIDVYTQVMLNWDRFIDYVWNNKKLIAKKKLGLEK